MWWMWLHISYAKWISLAYTDSCRGKSSSNIHLNTSFTKSSDNGEHLQIDLDDIMKQVGFRNESTDEVIETLTV